MFAGISSPDTVGGKSQCGDLLRKLTIDAARAIRSQDSQMLQPSHAGDDPQKKSEKASFTIFFSHRKKKETAFPGWFVDFMRSPYSFQVTSTASFWTV